MVYDIQKAGILRRISAGLFDIILLVVLACGIAWGISAIIDIWSPSALIKKSSVSFEFFLLITYHLFIETVSHNTACKVNHSIVN